MIQNTEKPADVTPRRFDIAANTPAELAIRAAMRAVEDAGADPLLTQAVILLNQAREKVADFVDNVQHSPIRDPRGVDGRPLMVPSPGRIVHFCLSESNVRDIASQNLGGNQPRAGEVYPAIIVRTWHPTDTLAPESQAVQLQVFIDGPRSYWATSRHQKADDENANLPAPGCWIEPPRITAAAR